MYLYACVYMCVMCMCRSQLSPPQSFNGDHKADYQKTDHCQHIYCIDTGSIYGVFSYQSQMCGVKAETFYYFLVLLNKKDFSYWTHTVLCRYLRKEKETKQSIKPTQKRIENGKIILDLPLVPFNGKIVPLFQVKVISPTVGPEESLKVNDKYCRHILSSYGVLQIPVAYWKSSLKKFYSDTIVTGSNKGVIATEDKVVVDFEITHREPSYVQLIPLLSRIKKRLGEDEIKLFQMRTGQL